MKVQKDLMVEGEKLDIERDKVESDATINIMKMATDVNKEDSEEAMLMFKENMVNSREALKSKADEKIARADNQMKHIDKARAFTDKGFQFTRRIIALSAVGAIIVWPKIAPVFFDTTVILTWTEFTRGFLFLIESKELVMDKEFNGLIITPLDTHLMSAIVGLYFGGSLVKR